MKSICFITASWMLCSSATMAQNCDGYLSFQKGSHIKYVLTDKKNKASGTVEYNVKDVRKESGGLIADMTSKFTDEKGKEMSNSTFTLMCQGDKLVIDMRSMISDQTLEAFKDMTMKAEGGNLEIPFSAAVGSWLPDATMHMDIIDKGQSFATIDITITDRRVEAKEDVTTPVGVFSCVKISYNSETKMKTMGIGVPMNLHSVTWYSKKVGMVKSDSFSRDMKPMGSRILTEVSQ